MKIHKHPYWTKYAASENGSVYGSRGYELKPIKHHTGYAVLTVRKFGEQKQLRVHRFVWECCKGAIPQGMVINHKDGDKHNNTIDNLEVVTNQENIIHAWTVLKRKPQSGESNSMSKLTNEDAKRVIELCAEGVSNPEIARMFGLHPNYVSLIRHNKRWKHLPR